MGIRNNATGDTVVIHLDVPLKCSKSVQLVTSADFSISTQLVGWEE